MEFIKVSEDKNFYTIALNRPDKRNAFHPKMIDELTIAFENANKSKARAVIFSGEGKSFCAGADLDWMQSMVDYSMEENIEDSNKLFEMFFTALSCEKPIITYVHGHAMGGALGLIAVSDIVVAEEATLFSFSEVKLGLAPAVISPFVLGRTAPGYVQQYMLTGERFDSQQAKQAGLVQHVLNEQGCKAKLKEIKNHICQNGPEAMQATKRLLTYKLIHSIYNEKDFVSEVIAERRVSKEGQQGLKGFIGKTEIPWKMKGEDA